MISDALLSSKSQEWETPNYFFECINDRYHFTLDVCATEKNTKVSRYYSPSDDGLSKSWDGETVWMNPPYTSKKKGQPGQIDWVRKAYEAVKIHNCNTVVCLLPARTDTRLFHDYVMRASLVLFIRGRLKFVGAPANAVFPSMLVTYERWNKMQIQHGPIFSTITAKGGNVYNY